MNNIIEKYIDKDNVITNICELKDMLNIMESEIIVPTSGGKKNGR